MFKISVIVPCYNVSNYIDRCLTSIVNQTIGIDSLQIICVDDASTDDTLLCLQRWEQQYPDNILLIPLETNSRTRTCRNVGMQYVDAPWVTFIDSDDWITSMLIKWKEWGNRELFKLYQDELEFDFLTLGYLGFIRTLILRYNSPPYSLYLFARRFTLEHIPNYRLNPYITENLDEFKQLLLSTLTIELSKKEFNLLIKNARIYFAIHG